MNKASLILIPVLILAMMLIGCNKRVLPDELASDGGIEYYQGEPFTGIAWTPGYPGNYIRIESEYEDGNLIEVRIFYPNGQLSEQVHYKNGNFHGNYKKLNENGEYTKQAQYKDGEKDGSTKFYDSKGQLKYEQEWKDGERVSEKTY